MIRYPRTPHLPWSPGASSDDLRLNRLAFEGLEVVITEKLDGENTTLHAHGLHARSPDSAHHPSRTRVKALHARIAASLPEDVRVCGENLAARHSLAYEDLLGWFYVFSVWRADRALDWDATVRFAEERGLPTPGVLYRGRWDERWVRRLRVDADRQEGYVVRTVQGFERAAFARHVAKWVRPHHVQTNEHWMNQPVVWNRLGPGAVSYTVRSGGTIDVAALRDWLGCGQGAAYDHGGLGEARLEGLIASQLLNEPVAERLPTLAAVLGLRRATRVVHLASLQSRLSLAIDEHTREGGLVSLARATDLRLLHGLNQHLHPDDETVVWSRLVTEEAGLWERDPLAPWCERLRELLSDPPNWHHLRGEALWMRSAGRLRSPEEAAACLHPLLNRPVHTLTLLVGPSGSGKSTHARTLSGIRIELDALRDGFDPKQERRVMQQACATLRTELADHDVVWDATSLTPTQRAVPLKIARSLGAHTVICSLLTPRSVAVSRNRARKHPVPEGVIERQWARLRWPLPHEAHQLEWHAYL